MTSIKHQLEKDIQLAICDYLALKKYLFWRQNTGGVYDAKAGFHRPMPKYAMNGVADILLIKDGLFVGIEVKRPSGKQSDAQKEFERLLKENGGAYLIATSLEDVIKYGL